MLRIIIVRGCEYSVLRLCFALLCGLYALFSFPMHTVCTFSYLWLFVIMFTRYSVGLISPWFMVIMIYLALLQHWYTCPSHWVHRFGYDSYFSYCLRLPPLVILTDIHHSHVYLQYRYFILHVMQFILITCQSLSDTALGVCR